MQDSRPMEQATLLAGIRVLDLSIWRPGPYATSLLVALGADVLKVEPPGGDPMRHYSGLFDVINAGKRSVELDLKDEGNRSRALELAAGADVMVEGFRPGVMARLGLDYDAVRRVNPSVVYCSISGYGQSGPPRRSAGTRRELPGLGGRTVARRGCCRDAPAADRRLGVGNDRRIRGLRRHPRARRDRRRHIPRRLHDRRDGDMDGAVRRIRGVSTTSARRRPCPATASSPPPRAVRLPWAS